MSDDASTDVTSLTVQLLSVYLSNNTVASGDLAGLIATTRAALAGEGQSASTVEKMTYEPAVTVRKSTASREHIISMIDGKPYKVLKRHLALHGLTPAEYKERYNLPTNYPMVARAYSEQRREAAKTLGLGRKGRGEVSDAPAIPVEAVAETKPKAAVPKSVKPARKAKSAGKAVAKAATAVEPGIAEKPVVSAHRKSKAKTEITTEVLPVREPAVAADVTPFAAPKAPRKKAEPKAKAAAKPKALTSAAAKPVAKKSSNVASSAEAAASVPDAGDAAPAKPAKAARKPKPVEATTVDAGL
ncbi:MAG: MucR family transcriptional regulator [Sphingomonadales bacterium]|nr:MucR family transcriptional regulator [Sphingomonadales bacterium]